MEKQFNLEVDSNGMISSREIYDYLGIKKDYTDWVKYWVKEAGYEEGIEFVRQTKQSTGGRPLTDYLVNKDMAMTLVMVSGGQFANKLRKYLIQLFDKRENLELITPEEAAYAMTIIDCLQYINNQKQCYEMHLDHYIKTTVPTTNVWASFNYYRNNITGWDKKKIEQAFNEYMIKNQRPMKPKNNMDSLNIMDSSEALRVATMDLLLSRDTSLDSVNKFANLVKRMANLRGVKTFRENETNLFQEKNLMASFESIHQKQIK
jgi:phage anti-repressor protein